MRRGRRFRRQRCAEPHSCSEGILSCYPYRNCVVKCVGHGSCEQQALALRTHEVEQAVERHGDGQDGHDSHPETSARLWAEFLAFALLTAVAGHIIGQAGLAIVAKTGISETAVGTFLTAISTSFPEFVSAIAAVRIGAVNLAVGDIIGGNAFDVLFLAASDIAYREGSIYAAFSNQHLFTIALVILMSGVLLLGMLNRERRGMGNIGWESVAMLGLYGASVFYLAG